MIYKQVLEMKGLAGWKLPKHCWHLLAKRQPKKKRVGKSIMQKISKKVFNMTLMCWMQLKWQCLTTSMLGTRQSIAGKKPNCRKDSGSDRSSLEGKRRHYHRRLTSEQHEKFINIRVGSFNFKHKPIQHSNEQYWHIIFWSCWFTCGLKAKSLSWKLLTNIFYVTMPTWKGT